MIPTSLLSSSISRTSTPQFSKPILSLWGVCSAQTQEISSLWVAVFLEPEHAFSDPFNFALNQLPGHSGLLEFPDG